MAKEKTKTVVYVGTSPSGKHYVGKTVMGFSRRWHRHISDAKQHYNQMLFHYAIRKYGADAFTFIILPCVGASNIELSLWERLLIQMLRGLGAKLYNLTNGGDGMWGHSPSAETRAKKSVSARAAHARPEVKDKHRAARKRLRGDPELIEKHRIGTAAAWKRSEVRDKHKAAHARLRQDPTRHAVLSEAAKQRYREHPETRQKLSDAAKRRYEDPEERRKASVRARAYLERHKSQ